MRTTLPVLLAGAAALVAVMDAPAAAPAAGDTWVYRVVNAYSKEVRGQLHYRVDRADSSAVIVTVTPDHPSVGFARTEIYTPEGNGLRQPVESHGEAVDYAFATPYPAYVFPLDAGKTWSTRVNATAHGDSRTRSVRVDGKVLGAERIRVPAGEFDAVKVRRVVYPGDLTPGRTETRIVETDWYVPALARPVRTERQSRWEEPGRCGQNQPCTVSGGWDVHELIEARAAKK